jgi:hypothetical protein
MAKRRVAPRFYVFLFIVVAIIFGIIYVLIQPEREAKIEYGSIEFRRYFDGVVVRDEDIVEVEEFGKVEYHIAEGVNVVKGELVASAYKLNYNEKIVLELTDIRQQIKDYQENILLKDIVNVELTNINKNIEEKSVEIRKSVQGNSDIDLLKLERELAEIMESKESYLKTAVKPDEKLNELYDKKDEILGSIEGWKDDLWAVSSGVVSFYFDGQEKFLNIENLDSYDVNDVQNIINETDVTDFMVDEVSYPIYKVVNNTRWYIVVESDRNIPEFNKNTYFTMIFDQNTEKQHIGQLLGKRIYGNGYVYTFEFTNEIDQLLDARVVSIEMYNVFNGLLIPEDAIKIEDNIRYINIVTEEGLEKIPITVATIKDGVALIREKTGYQELNIDDKIVY